MTILLEARIQCSGPSASTPDAETLGMNETRRGRWAATALVGALAFFAVVAHSSALTSDSYFNLYTGRYVAAHGIPHHEAFTAANAGGSWLDQQWLAHLAYYACWVLGGERLYILVSAALVAGAIAILASALMRAGLATRWAAAWSLLALAGCLSNTSPRAQSFAYPLFVVVVSCVYADLRRDRWDARILLLIPVLALWANLHGSVLMGAGIVTAYGAYRAVVGCWHRRIDVVIGYGVLAVLAAVSPLATPYGTQIIGYYRGVLANPVLTRTISEWKQPSINDGVSMLYFVTVGIVILLVTITSVRRRQLPPLLPLAITAVLLVLSLRSIRNEVWFVFAGTLFAALFVHRRTTSTTPRTYRLAGIVAVAAAATVVATVNMTFQRPNSEFEHGVSQRTLAAADAASRAAGNQPIITNDTLATALLWFRPDTVGRVAFDIRYEDYSQQLLSSYVSLLQGRSLSEGLTARFPVVLLSKAQNRAALAKFGKSPQWRLVSSADGAALFTRAGLG